MELQEDFGIRKDISSRTEKKGFGNLKMLGKKELRQQDKKTGLNREGMMGMKVCVYWQGLWMKYNIRFTRRRMMKKPEEEGMLKKVSQAGHHQYKKRKQMKERETSIRKRKAEKRREDY